MQPKNSNQLIFSNIDLNKNPKTSNTKILKYSFVFLAASFVFLQVASFTTLINASAAVDTLTHTNTATFVDKNGNGLADIGDTVDYEMTITNTGPQAITGVNPVKNICAMLQPKVDLAVGATSTKYTCSYAITAADIAAGKVVSTSQAWAYSSATNLYAVIYSPEVITTTPLTAASDKLTQTLVGTFVDKNGNGTADVGDVVDYVFTITNSGTSDLTAINPEKASSIGCAALQPKVALKAGASTSVFTCSHVITAAEITAKEVVNTSNAWAYNPAFAIIRSADATATTPLTPTPAAVDSLTHTLVGTFSDKNGNGTADVGDMIDYQYTIKNSGTSKLTAVDPIAGPCVGTQAKIILDVAASDSTTFKCSVAITAADITAGKVTTKSKAWSYNPALAIIYSPEVTLDVPLTPTPAKVDKLTQTVAGTFNDKNGNGLADVGDTIDYVYTITNSGTSDLTAVNPVTSSVCLPLQPKVALKAGAADSTTFTCTYSITAADITAGKVVNDTKAWSYNPALAIIYSAGEKTTTPLAGAADKLTQTVVGTYIDTNSNGKVDLGDTVDYAYTITNSGTSDLTAVNPVTSSVCLPLQPKVALKAGAVDSTTFTCTYSITAADVTAGEVTNVSKAWSYNPVYAIVYSAPDKTITPLTAIPVVSDYDVVKEGTFVDKNNDGIGNVGDTIEYTFTIDNTSGDVIKSVKVTDDKCTVTGSLATLAMDATDATTFKCSYVITAADVTATFVENTATSTALEATGATLNSTSNTVKTILPVKQTVTPPVTPPVTPAPTPIKTNVYTPPSATTKPASTTGTPRTGGNTNYVGTFTCLIGLAYLLLNRRTLTKVIK
jgi:uncharacterized phage-associated protein